MYINIFIYICTCKYVSQADSIPEVIEVVGHIMTMAMMSACIVNVATCDVTL